MGLDEFNTDDDSDDEQYSNDLINNIERGSVDRKLTTEELEQMDFYFEPTKQGELLKEQGVENALAHVYSPKVVKRLLRVDYEEVDRDE